MNDRESVKTRMDAVEKRYGKTTKGTAEKAKVKKKLKPKVGKKKIGLTYEIKF